MLPFQPLLLFALVVVLYLLSSIKILAEYERGVIFRLGKLLPQPKGPGVILVFPPIDKMVRVSLRTIVMDVPPQDVITRDNVSVKVNAVVYYRVVDPRRAIVEVEDYTYATSQRRRPATGSAGMVGTPATTLGPIAPGSPGRVATHGEIWSAVSAEAIAEGTEVFIVGIDGLTLSVSRKRPES